MDSDNVVLDNMKSKRLKLELMNGSLELKHADLGQLDVDLKGDGIVNLRLADDNKIKKVNINSTGFVDTFVSNIKTGELFVKKDGKGCLDIRGFASYQNVHVNGFGILNALNLISTKADLSKSGDGEVFLKVDDELVIVGHEGKRGGSSL